MARVVLFVLLSVTAAQVCYGQARRRGPEVITLPSVQRQGEMSLEQAFSARESFVGFSDEQPGLSMISQLLWAGYGRMDPEQSERTVLPAAGAYPASLYLLNDQGIFRYDSAQHALVKLDDSDARLELADAVSDEFDAVGRAPFTIIVAGSLSELPRRSGARGQRLLQIHAGSIAQNIILQSSALGLRTIGVDDFDSRRIRRTARLPAHVEPYYLISGGMPDEQAEQAAIEGQGLQILFVSPRSNFDDDQLFVTRRYLTDAEFNVEIASTRRRELRGERDGVIRAQQRIEYADVNDYEAVVFVGGYGTEGFYTHGTILRLARRFHEEGKVVAAIGNSAMILANADLLQGRIGTGDPELRGRMSERGTLFVNEPVVRDGRIITARDSQAAEEFAAAVHQEISRLKTNQD